MSFQGGLGIYVEIQSGAFETQFPYVVSLDREYLLHVTSSRLDDFFQYSYTYTVMITIFLRGKLLPLKYPR